MTRLYYESAYGRSLAHAERDDHKYIYKKFENGKWRYYYDDPRKTKEPGKYKDDKGNTITVKNTAFSGRQKMTTQVLGSNSKSTHETIEVGATERGLKKAKDAVSNAGDKLKDAFGVDEKQKMEKAKKNYLKATGNAKSVNEANLRTAASKTNITMNANKDNQYAKDVVSRNAKDLAKQEKAKAEYEKAEKAYKSKPIAATDKISEIGDSVKERGKSIVDGLFKKRKKK